MRSVSCLSDIFGDMLLYLAGSYCFSGGGWDYPVTEKEKLTIQLSAAFYFENGNRKFPCI